MANEENVNLDTPNEELDEQEQLVTGEEDVNDIDDPDVLKENLAKVQKANSQLFARTKRAEGFVQGEDGKWVKKPVEQPKALEKKPETPVAVDVDKLLDEKLEKRELEALDLSDTLKKEVQNYAKLSGVSVKKALSSEYIQFMVAKEEKAQNAENASLGGGKRGAAKKDYSEMNPNDFDFTTPEGRAEFKKWEEVMRKQLG